MIDIKVIIDILDKKIQVQKDLKNKIELLDLVNIRANLQKLQKEQKLLMQLVDFQDSIIEETYAMNWKVYFPDMTQEDWFLKLQELQDSLNLIKI